MEPSNALSIIGEVKEFLSSLKTDWPELFPVKINVAVPKRPKAETNPLPLQVQLPLSVLPEFLIPSVAVDAPLSLMPAGDLILIFRARAEFYAPLLGVTFGRISVKDQRSLWGSCTRAGNLNFSWRLALAPEPVLDYLVVHELAHRAQMNHSRRFWEVVERVCPSHRTHRRWLRKNGKALYEAKRAV
ncbi:MAG: M48 family metallopeptidase [Elusimicrobia bacterium]|nr:M48 family metallopeptidase [Elusimicrobiota bacterium]